MNVVAELCERYSSLWELNDGAHRESHFEEVYKNFLEISRKLGITDPEFLNHGCVLAYTHDMYRHRDVANHHLLSAEWWRSNRGEFTSRYRAGTRERLARACAEHRASYRGTYSSRLSEVFAAADRGLPSTANIPGMLERSVRYHQDVHGAAGVEAVRMARLHLKEKFGTAGYAKYPALTEELFRDVLVEYRAAFDALC